MSTPQPFRTAAGGRIDRSGPRRFTFDGRTYEGFRGDTLASALIANGVHLVGRSFKYHRPRGILTAGSEEPNALVGIDRGRGRYTPNLRATQVELLQDLRSESQNRWPSLAFDLGTVNDLASPLIPAGFYYKTFMWPPSFWSKVYEPRIRAAAGLGRAPQEADPDRYTGRYAHCDVLVVGAGPAGIAAALAAAESGAEVILCDEQQELGGSLLAETKARIDGEPAERWLAAALSRLFADERVTVLPRTTAFGYFAENFVALAERVTDHLDNPDPRLPRERLWQVRAAEVVLAAGSHERPLVFPDNDRPGIMLAEAARSYLVRYGAKPGRRAVVVTACDTAYRAAIDLHAAGVEVATIADLRAAPGEAALAAARAAGLRVETSTAVIGTQGRARVAGVALGRIGPDGAVPRAGERIACDLVAMSGGWTPAVHLYSQSRGKVRWDEALQAFVPGPSVQRERSAGACRGTFDFASVIEEGYAAGDDAALKAGFRPRSGARAARVENAFSGGGGRLGTCPHPSVSGRVKAFVDFQNDVTAKDIKLAVREGFRSIEHVKRYTTTGMATDQGKTSNLNALAIAAGQLGTGIPSVGLTTFRQPYTPVTFGTMAGLSRGDLLDPVRVTPAHDWAVDQGAVFEDVGLWKRARYFPRRGEDMHAAVARECRAVRERVGLFDASTLGKIEVVGPDAGRFLDLMYTGAFSEQKVGRCGYGLMLREDGYVFDDGIIARLTQDRFHLTTTTSGAARVFAHMEDHLQTEWPDLDVWITSITEQWAVIAVQGPCARQVIAPLVDDIDMSRAALPAMSVQEGSILGIPTRLFALSFTGELGYEVNVPSEYGLAVWEAIWEQARRFDSVAYGTEAMHVLRAEKGFIIVGQDTDGTVTPDDLGMSWAIGKAKTDFVGKRSLARPDLVASGRRQLVGLETLVPSTVIEEGAQITVRPDPPSGTAALGHVTSSYWSSMLGRSIALALVADGRARLGDVVHVPMPDGAVPAKVVEPIFYKQRARSDA